ncbi:BRO-N domain-containing protein [Yersinia enterocolitica]|nr:MULTISPECIES: BRO family protein [Yersinia]ELI7924244.1 hypothetical protein [Yersinia enterocolitica]HDL7321496.1 hypothetical protein [Yersinia enterocolitica]HDL7455112.1 hypothetical protein [Yersinia enterocolitica]HDM8092990.1 hypothetical protein [Yersinia enterocolitica]
MDDNNNLINVCYEGSSGSTDIRTYYIDGILHFSLKDIFIILNKENRAMGEENPRYIPNLIKNQIKELDQDEYTMLLDPNESFAGQKEVYITQPGLNRVMGNDKSKAGRKFQRWLYHDVVPSLTKHGKYPPPATPQGSALSQMAEIIAQNSRALADSIIRQDMLEKEVNMVKGEVKSVSSRLSKLEQDTLTSDYIMTVRLWFENAGLVLTAEKEFEIVTWCENLSLNRAKPIENCPSGERLRAKFYAEIIEEAKKLVEQSKG